METPFINNSVKGNAFPKKFKDDATPEGASGSPKSKSKHGGLEKPEVWAKKGSKGTVAVEKDAASLPVQGGKFPTENIGKQEANISEGGAEQSVHDPLDNGKQQPDILVRGTGNGRVSLPDGNRKQRYKNRPKYGDIAVAADWSRTIDKATGEQMAYKEILEGRTVEEIRVDREEKEEKKRIADEAKAESERLKAEAVAKRHAAIMSQMESMQVRFVEGDRKPLVSFLTATVVALALTVFVFYLAEGRMNFAMNEHTAQPAGDNLMYLNPHGLGPSTGVNDALSWLASFSRVSKPTRISIFYDYLVDGYSCLRVYADLGYLASKDKIIETVHEISKLTDVASQTAFREKEKIDGFRNYVVEQSMHYYEDVKHRVDGVVDVVPVYLSDAVEIAYKNYDYFKFKYDDFIWIKSFDYDFFIRSELHSLLHPLLGDPVLVSTIVNRNNVDRAVEHFYDIYLDYELERYRGVIKMAKIKDQCLSSLSNHSLEIQNFLTGENYQWLESHLASLKLSMDEQANLVVLEATNTFGRVRPFVDNARGRVETLLDLMYQQGVSPAEAFVLIDEGRKAVVNIAVRALQGYQSAVRYGVYKAAEAGGLAPHSYEKHYVHHTSPSTRVVPFRILTVFGMFASTLASTVSSAVSHHSLLYEIFVKQSLFSFLDFIYFLLVWFMLTALIYCGGHICLFNRVHTYTFVSNIAAGAVNVDVRNDIMRLGDLVHWDPLYCFFSYSWEYEWGKTLAIYRWLTDSWEIMSSRVHAKTILVSVELYVQLCNAKNLVLRGLTDAEIGDRMKRSAANFCSVNVERHLVALPEHIVQQTTILSFACYKQMTERLEEMPFPQSPATSN